VLNKVGNCVFSDIAEFTLSVASSLIILIIYNIVRFAGASRITILPIVLCALMIVLLILKPSIIRAVSSHINSGHCCIFGKNMVSTKRDVGCIRSERSAQTRVDSCSKTFLTKPKQLRPQIIWKYHFTKHNNLSLYHILLLDCMVGTVCL